MSGHNKWSQIKRQKGAADAKRGVAFTKLGNAITLAAKQGGGDATTNFKLRLAIEKARELNMPNANIDRAIKRGTGELGGAQVEELLYEAYGPAGSAFIIEGITDNRNRTIQEVKSALNKNGGRLGETGSVAWMFETKGVIVLEKSNNPDIEEIIIDSGADDYSEIDGHFTVYTNPKELDLVKKNLQEKGLEIQTAELSMEPKNIVQINDKSQASQALRLVEGLESSDDINQVYSNFDIPEDLLKEL